MLFISFIGSTSIKQDTSVQPTYHIPLFIAFEYIIILIIYSTTNEVPCCLCSPRPLRQERNQYNFVYVDAQDLKSLLGSVQSHATDDEINDVIKAVRGKPIHQLIAEGQARLGSATPATVAKPVEKKEAPKK